VTILELRQYSLRPGRRDELIELFEREFVESQEELGARIVGTFRDLGDPDRFVWIREFADMAARRAALAGFYGGPVWRAHRSAANATMIDSDDVLMLEPVGPGLPDASRAAVGSGSSGPSRVLVVVRSGEGLEPSVAEAERLLGVRPVVACSAPYVNDFPALPVRDEQVVVWFASFADAAALQAAREPLHAEPAWRAGTQAIQLLELEPTPRSALR
jgi:quinol monooxygenase YgiN